ncbi:signal recognition particle [Novymonas esmeraldas]|uniref:Signal recognition particle 54 kDa protein n=1 Tax=Novymonas esmeraldas TaxID=1808958 RepID=A0AAW0ELD3_9TRYP
MVLAELGKKIEQAIYRMSAKSVLGEDDVKELLNEIARALLQADVNVAIVKKLQVSIKTELALAEEGAGLSKRKILRNAVFNGLKRILDPGVQPFMPTKGKQSVVMFVGLQGSGKTTSCTKYAAYFQRKGLKTALVCADTFRAGAYDQLRQNATKAKVRFYGSLTEADPVTIAREGVAELKKEKYDLIIVDTSGRHKQESALFEEMKQVELAVKPNDIVFVMSATDGQAVEEQARNFKEMVAVGSVIVTKLDCQTKGGGALSAVAATRSPIVFIGTGEHFDDFDLFQPERFVQKMLGMGDIGGLMETMRDANIDGNDELYKRLQDGQFTMRDMYEHLQNVLKMGSVGKIMEMLPGMSGLAGAAGQQGDIALKGFIHMLDSMTAAELDEAKVKKMMTPSRMHRIARGSGHSVVEVQNLIISYTKFEEIVKKMGKMNFKAMTQDPSGLGAGRMGQQQMGQLAKLINPNVLRQLGGMGGLQGMMKQLQQGMGGGGGGGGGAGGMPDMSAMANMMQMMQQQQPQQKGGRR